MLAVPETRYVRSGDAHIAYQVIGQGPFDLVHIRGFVSHVEYVWEYPAAARFLQRLASFSRLILLDKRGTGLSDRVADTALPTLEQRMDDVRAVMDAVGSQRATLFGESEGGPMSILFAATYPERTAGLILYGTYARRLRAADYPWAPSSEEWDTIIEQSARDWGGPVGLAQRAPSASGDEYLKKWWSTYLRLGASPGAVSAIWRMARDLDVRHILSSVHVPTLILHRAGDRAIPVENARYLAQHIQGAQYKELPGDDHLYWIGDMAAILDEIEEFVTGTRRDAEIDRVLATVLFTDIVGSTQRAAELGDQRWRELLDRHNVLVRRELARFRGREIHTAGDSFLATFDGPARAIRCALAAAEVLKPLEVEIRAGLHTGEIELMGDDIGGIAVHVGARIMALAGASEVLVSSTVKDLVAGSGLQFTEFGVHVLKGVPGEWRVFAVKS